MPASSLSLYNENTGTTVFALQSTSALKSVWAVTGRSLAMPLTVSVERKLTPNAAGGNDHILISVSQTEKSTYSPYKLTNFTAKLDLSIPKDWSGFTGGTSSDMLKRIANLISVLNNAAALNVANASNTNLNAVFSGGDF